MKQQQRFNVENQGSRIFGGIPEIRIIRVLNRHKTGKPEEIYWAK